MLKKLFSFDRICQRLVIRCFQSQVGAIFMINGKVVGMDSFGKADSFSKFFNKLVESYALDAVDWFEPEKEHKSLKNEVTNFLNYTKESRVESHPAVGLGTDYRIETGSLTGFALAMGDDLLHLSVFTRSNGKDRRVYSSGMRRFSSRRRNRI